MMFSPWMTVACVLVDKQKQKQNKNQKPNQHPGEHYFK